jgi:HlyD family secretion protein
MAAKLRTRRVVLIAAAVLGVVAIALLLLPRAVPVDAATVVRGPIAETVYDQGQARVRDSYVAAAPVAGRLMRITLQVGDPVAAGQVVARIAPAAAALLDPSVRAQREASLASAQADLDRAQAEKVRAEETLARTQRLVDGGLASRQTLDNDRAAARSAAAASAAAEAAVRAARAGLIGPGAGGGPLVPVITPAGGYVTRVLEPSERTVPAGAPLLEVGDTRDLEAVIEFRSEDAARIRPGMPAEVYDWGGPTVLGARVRLVEPQGFTKVSALGVEEQRALVWLQITDPRDRWASLGPGYRVWGRVFLRREPSALTVPLGALQRRGGGWAVFRIEGGRARLRAVTVGAIGDSDAEIRSGLQAGDRVVSFPSDAVKDGVRVSVRRP